jgi:hypothetical protein
MEHIAHPMTNNLIKQPTPMKLSTRFKTLALIATMALATSACSRAPSNVHVISTTNCGASWTKLNVGETVPKHTGNPCGYTVAIPNWPMAGEVKFKTQFAREVLSDVEMSFTYIIVDPIKYISYARYLGKMGESLEISAESVGGRYEMAENIIIDKLLRAVTTEHTRNIDVVGANPAEIEDHIFSRVKRDLNNKGVEIPDLALVIKNDELTRLAIDAATAVRVYDNAGIGDVGRKVIVARAGAARINVNAGK